ncbi:hypothetical protein HNQ56_000589 [Anaerotaenia torta]|uniref:DUF3502 domain-containing protein n=1 Tax=Anaerotaenia torta TaxID=433293 RepID=UPI003D1ED79B
MKKRWLALLLAVTMIVGLTACGKTNKPSTDDGKNNPTSGAQTGGDTKTDGDTSGGDTAGIDTSEHVVINYMTTGDPKDNGATEAMLEELNKILTEKVNAELQIYYIGWTDYLANYNLTLAQMDGSVDLIGTASDWLDAWPNAKNGAFLELSEDMLKTYAPKTWESVSPEHWELCKYNGEIYLMPEDNYAQWVNHGYAYRLDWAKQAGLANGVHSWEDLTTYFEWVKKNITDINIPWDSDGTHHSQMVGGWITSHTDWVTIDGLSAGALWGGMKDDLYTIVSPYYTDAALLVEYAKMMKKWDEIGVWKTDVLNNTGVDNREDFKIGKVAAEQHHTQTWTDLVSKTPLEVEGAEVGFFYFGEETNNVVALSITHGAMAVSAASKNPERALMVYDLLRNDPDCYKLLNYGQKGVQWDINADGLRIEAPGYDRATQEIVTNYWWGRNDDLEIRDATRDWNAIDALYAKYDSIKIDYPYGQFVPDVDNIQSMISNISEVHTNYMKQISYGKYKGTAEEIVAEYQKALKNAGFEEVTAELQRQFDALYK